MWSLIAGSALAWGGVLGLLEEVPLALCVQQQLPARELRNDRAAAEEEAVEETNLP